MRSVITAVAALILSHAACGGDTKSGSDATRDATAPTDATTPTDTTTPTDATTPADATTPTDATPTDATAPEDAPILDPSDVAHAALDGCALPECAVVMPPITLSHSGGAELELLADPRLDDAIARWGDCLGDVTDCLRRGEPLGACLDGAARCDPTCIAQVRAARATPTWSDFRAVFLSEGAPCRPTAP